jgi:hypothetical protein
MDAYDSCTNLEKKILPIVLPSMVEAENFSGHPHISPTLLLSSVHLITNTFKLAPHVVQDNEGIYIGTVSLA